LGRTLERAEEWRAATLAYAEALQRGAAGADIHLRLGNLHLRQGQHGPARKHLNAVLADQPDNAEALFALGMLMHRLHRYDDAAKRLQAAAQRQPDSPQIQFNLGLARFEAGDLHGAMKAFAQSHALCRGAPWTGNPAAELAREHEPPLAAGEIGVNEVKLRHDLEQLEYLLELGRLPAAYREVAGEYRALLKETQGVTGGGVVVPFNVHRYPLVARTYKRPLHLDPGAAGGAPVLNPALDAKRLESQYLRAKPNVVVVDDLLSAEALGALRRFCRESTIWNNVQSGYLGAYFYDGFACELLLRIGQQLRARFPRVIRGLPLQMAWGYKYDCTLQGIGVHADAAAVNVNFWITEDDANLDPEGGGLLIYEHDAPAEWGFTKFNRDPAAILGYLQSVGSVPLRVPHRANRAVIFDSDLFHATDALRFREGYCNRRINVTLLYGLRGS
jgi:tetratricopeptide (TPR) repeat protein